jgi:hypothetical protein
MKVLSNLVAAMPRGGLLKTHNSRNGLAFVGMPLAYTYDLAFWLKMFAILLAGLNVAAFYLTGTFARVEKTGAGEDAPLLAKLIAAGSLFFWFAVICFGPLHRAFQRHDLVGFKLAASAIDY